MLTLLEDKVAVVLGKNKKAGLVNNLNQHPNRTGKEFLAPQPFRFPIADERRLALQSLVLLCFLWAIFTGNPFTPDREGTCHLVFLWFLLASVASDDNENGQDLLPAVTGRRRDLLSTSFIVFLRHNAIFRPC